MTYLSKVSRLELVNELASREGVATHDVSEYEGYKLQKTLVCGKTEIMECHHGPILIITVVD
jgi:hypothetical protein